jgi:hypothetical protein
MSPQRASSIPFIKTGEIGGKVFSEIGAAGGVDDPTQMVKGWTGSGAGGLMFEAAVGDYLTSPAGLLQTLAARRRAVAIVRARGTDYKGVTGRWNGTAVLVGRNLLLTNHHVIHSVEAAQTARIEFDYEISPEDLLCGNIQPPAATRTFAIDPNRLFVTSPTEGGLDYTFVWIEDAAAAAQGFVPMDRSAFTVDKGESAFVVHHPDGKPKEVSLDDAEIIGLEATVIHYSADTMKGSSGAPVFDRRGRLVGLHHASRDGEFKLKDGTPVTTANEGIKISAIALDLETRVKKGGRDSSQAEAVLKEIGGSDTMSGFFGGLGRQFSTEATATATEAVVKTYLGTDQDVDVGFWNVESLAQQWKDPNKLSAAARVIADLNLDLWGLLGIGEPALQALIKTLEVKYGTQYAYAFSEAGAPAMMWKRSSLVGERAVWPSKLEPLFHRRSGHDDPKDSATAPVFDRYPGLFRFETLGKQPAETFFVVPLHLKAMDGGSLSRRLAARILARAVEDLALSAKADVIVGGHMNAPLAPNDFSRLEDKGFLVLGARDEYESAFSYIKSPTSAVDSIYLSPDMRQTIGKVDYFIVARDRTMPDYRDVSDEPPLAVRLTLTSSPLSERSLDRAALDKLIDGMLPPSTFA